MTVLGFSHIVTEIKDFEKSISYYEKIGYSVEFQISQAVPDEKKYILKQNPSEVDLYYLRHQISPRIGVELIKHNESSEGKRTKNMAYGWSFSDSRFSLVKDPDDNILIEFPYLGKGPNQHIFLPTYKFHETLYFYKNIFSLKLLENISDFDLHYKELYQKTGRSAVLTLRNCLYQNWNLALHLIETEKEKEEICLNETGFSCFCFLINQAGFDCLQKKALDMVGPLVGEKNVKDNFVKFRFGFIRDPNQYLVEYYLP